MIKDETQEATTPTSELETAATEPPPKAKRGFATWTPEERAEVARKGGIAAHAQGTAHRWTVEKAREAGRKGGHAPHVTRGRGAKRRAAQQA